jgi:hypothetical protein
MKTPVIYTDEYIVYVEDVQGYTFIHMDVFKWTKTIKSRFLKDWLDWASKQSKPIYAMPFIDDDKMSKWAVICGFKILEMHRCTDGVIRKLYKWSK